MGGGSGHPWKIWLFPEQQNIQTAIQRVSLRSLTACVCVPPTDELLPPAQSTAQPALAFAVLAVVMAAALLLALFLYQRRKGNRPAPQFTSLQGFFCSNSAPVGCRWRYSNRAREKRKFLTSDWGFMRVTRTCCHVSVTLQWDSVVSLETPLGDTSPETGI